MSDPNQTPSSLGRRQVVWLLLLGGLLAAVTFVASNQLPLSPFHPSRDAELKATYAAFLETGVPLIKATATGAPYPRVPHAPRKYEPAAWDDDPGPYLVASYVGRAVSVADPYRALHWTMSLLAALPWLLLPLAIARLFDRFGPGLAVALAPLAALVLRGSLVLGNDYGTMGKGTGYIYAMYGLPGAWLFLWLALLLLIATFSIRRWPIVILTLSIGMAAGFTNFLRSWSGLGLVLAAGVVVGMSVNRRRLLTGLLVSTVALAISLGIPRFTMNALEAKRATVTGIASGLLPTGHPMWHNPYLGFGYQGLSDGYRTPNPFGIKWSDDFAVEKARQVNPQVLAFGIEYDSIMRDLFFRELRAHPWLAIRTFAAKFADTLGQNLLPILFIAVIALGSVVLKRYSTGFTTALVMATPTFLYGLVPPVVVMPLKYYFVELTAALSILIVVAIGACAHALPPRPNKVLQKLARRGANQN